MVHCSSIPTPIYGRVFPLPLPYEFAFVSHCCQIAPVFKHGYDMSAVCFDNER